MQQPTIRNMRSIYTETHTKHNMHKKHKTYKKWTGRAGLTHLDFSSIANTVQIPQQDDPAQQTAHSRSTPLTTSALTLCSWLGCGSSALIALVTQLFWFNFCFDFCFDGAPVGSLGLASTPNFLLLPDDAVKRGLPALISVRSVETTLRHNSLKNHRYYQTIRLVRNERIFKIHNV